MGVGAMPARGSRFIYLLLSSLFVIGLNSSTLWAQAQRTDTISLHGAGSTFAAPLYKKLIESYTASHLSISLSYDVVGSGEGVRRFLSDAVDFAGSDEILNDR